MRSRSSASSGPGASWPVARTHDAKVKLPLRIAGGCLLMDHGFVGRRETGTQVRRESVLKHVGNRYADSMADLYVPRIVDWLLDELLISFPAISLAGPRAPGKTTTAVRRGGTVLRLDRPEVRQSVAASPDAMLTGLHPPVILDEWQEVPELLGAVKRSVDAVAPRPHGPGVSNGLKCCWAARGWPSGRRLTGRGQVLRTAGRAGSSRAGRVPGSGR
jgi:hypothetical protein